MDSLTELDLSTLDPGFTQDPRPTYASWREEAPVRRVVRYGLPAWLVTRSTDVLQVLTDPRLSNDKANAGPTIPRAVVFTGDELGLSKHMLFADPPDHTRLRRLVSKVFTPGRIETLRPKIQQITDDLIDRFLARGQAELLAEFAYPLPMTVISEILGVPEQDRDDFMRWIRAGLGVDAVDTAEVPAATAAVVSMVSALVESKRRRSPGAGSDLLTDLVAARDEDDRLSEDELRSLTFLLIVAGFETTAGLIGNGMLALLQHRDQMDLLRAEPDLTAQAVEEFLRFDSPVDIVGVRFATEEITIGGVVIPAGDAVLCSLASANRDLPISGDTDAMDLHRADSRHMSFGQGIHFCLGAPLARLEGQIAFRTLLDRCPDLALAVDPSELTRRPSAVGRPLTTLPVTFTPAPPQRPS